MTYPPATRLAIRCLLFSVCLLPACRQKMAQQPSYRPDQANSFFQDGRANRPAIPGTIARGHLRTDAQLFEGISSSSDAYSTAALILGAGNGYLPVALLAAVANNRENRVLRTFPFPVTGQVLQEGQTRYMIYCVVCHDPLGTGQGRIVERGYTPPPSYHIERLRQAPVGHLFEVITKGYGSMPSYKDQIPPQDRWAIIAYIRALQLSQHFLEKELPQDMRTQWAEQKQGAKAASIGGAP